MAKKYLITSALPYINGIKHLGNLIGSMLPADVYARYLRAREQEVLYICATDEHGTPAELAALEEGLSVQDYCQKMHDVQAELGRRFNLSFDHFGRSSRPPNHRLTRHLAQKLEENGYIEERITRQIFCIDDNRFLPDRYVIGTCPHCKNPSARGDQCESCTRLLDPTDLINPRSAVSGSTKLEVRESKHLFLLQSKLADELRTWIEAQRGWPLLTTSIALKWLDEGLQERGITRDLQWGVAVERPGFEGKVFYVWFDAPIAYIAATNEWSDLAPETRNWKDWWWDAKDVHYVQFMAKDNIPFHTIVFPATLIGSREPWKLPDMIKGFNWLTYQGGKFSTSQHRGVFMAEAADLLPTDYWRYWLLSNAPESTDSDFTWELFVGTINKDLVGVIGNFVNRVLKFAETRFGNSIPAGGTPGPLEEALFKEMTERQATLEKSFEDLAYRKALQELRAMWVACNTYINDAAPWKSFESDRERSALAVRIGQNLVRYMAMLSAPVMPDSAGKMLSAMSVKPEENIWPKKSIAEELATLAPGHTFTAPDLLFRKIADEEMAEWSARFAGVEKPAAAS